MSHRYFCISSSILLSNCGRFLWIWTELILSWLTIKYSENDENDLTDKWNETDKDPPCAASTVMKST